MVIGKFEEADFREKMQRGELPAGQYRYWHEGMPEWKPISEYRPPGRVTTILGNIPTREMKRQQMAGKAPRNSFFGDLKDRLRSKGKKKI